MDDEADGAAEEEGGGAAAKAAPLRLTVVQSEAIKKEKDKYIKQLDDLRLGGRLLARWRLNFGDYF